MFLPMLVLVEMFDSTGTGVSRNGQVFTFSDTSKQDNLTITVGSSGAVWTPSTSTLDLSSLSGDDVTAATVEALFNDSTASRGVSYSVSSGKIDTAVAADTSKQNNLTVTTGDSGVTWTPATSTLDLSAITGEDTELRNYS